MDVRSVISTGDKAKLIKMAHKHSSFILEVSIQQQLINYPMGSNQSSAIRLPLITKEHWHQIPLPPSIRRKPAHGHYKLFKNILTNERIEQYSLTLQGDDHQEYLQSFTFRQQQEALVGPRYFQFAKEDAFCSSRILAKVYLEHMPYRLSNIHDIAIPESLYVLKAALTGFQKLYGMRGGFKPNEDMVGIDCEGRVKVWLSSNFSFNLLSAPVYLQESDKQGETLMVLQIVSMVDKHTAYPLINFHKFMQYLQTAREPITFEVALRMVEEYSLKYRIPIPKYFVSMLRVLEKSRLSDDCESRSETNQPFSPLWEKPHIVHYISPVLLSHTNISSQIASKQQIKSLTCIQQESFQKTERHLITSKDSIKSNIFVNKDSRTTLPRVNFNYCSRENLKNQSPPLKRPLSSITERSSVQNVTVGKRVMYSDMHEDYELDQELAQDMVKFFSIS